MTDEEWSEDLRDGLIESWREVYGCDPEPEEIDAVLSGIPGYRS